MRARVVDAVKCRRDLADHPRFPVERDQHRHPRQWAAIRQVSERSDRDRSRHLDDRQAGIPLGIPVRSDDCVPMFAPQDRQHRVHVVALDRFASDFVKAAAAEGTKFGVTRIGVHTGEATVGNFGGDVFFDYTAMGDTMNVAARLEGAIEKVLADGARTADLMGPEGGTPLSTTEMGDVILEALDASL